MAGAFAYNPPPNWPITDPDWEPPLGWKPDPSWPPAPQGWSFWRPASTPATDPSPSAPTTPSPSPLSIDDRQSISPDPSLVAARDDLARTQADLVSARTELTEVRNDIARQRSALNHPEPAALPDSHGPAAGLVAPGVIDLNDERVMQEVGIYTYRHPLATSQEYRDRIRDIIERIKDTVRQGRAVLASDMFTFNSSLAKGRKMTGDFSKLMLRAYNAEADNAIRTMRAGNSLIAIRRLESSAETIAKLGAMMEMRVNPDYHSLRVEELELTQDYLMKQQEERERAREERERLREQRKVEQELEAERERLAKEKAHYLNVLNSLRQDGNAEAAAELAAKIEALDQAIATNDYRTANIRAGYVYVISNVGAFGYNVVKIGMTRRLEPMDRVRELGDASVPFPFDVHALYFSDDAVTLENQLHQEFTHQRLNHVNPRREFFFATPEQVRRVLGSKVGNLLEFTEEPEALQYFQSKKYWPS